jgi:hypothetical protein
MGSACAYSPDHGTVATYALSYLRQGVLPSTAEPWLRYPQSRLRCPTRCVVPYLPLPRNVAARALNFPLYRSPKWAKFVGMPRIIQKT